MDNKIEKYANETLAFYLHKNRNFLDKLEKTERDRQKEIAQKVEDEKLKEQLKKIKKDV